MRTLIGMTPNVEDAVRTPSHRWKMFTAGVPIALVLSWGSWHEKSLPWAAHLDGSLAWLKDFYPVYAATWLAIPAFLAELLFRGGHGVRAKVEREALVGIDPFGGKFRIPLSAVASFTIHPSQAKDVGSVVTLRNGRGKCLVHLHSRGCDYAELLAKLAEKPWIRRRGTASGLATATLRGNALFAACGVMTAEAPQKAHQFMRRAAARFLVIRPPDWPPPCTASPCWRELMTDRTIPKADWEAYFTVVSRLIEGERVEIEVAALDLGDQLESDYIPLEGLSYDPKDEALYVDSPLIEHRIDKPQEVYTIEEDGVLRAIGVKDHGGAWQILRLRVPLRLPGGAAAAAARPAGRRPEASPEA